LAFSFLDQRKHNLRLILMNNLIIQIAILLEMAVGRLIVVLEINHFKFLVGRLHLIRVEDQVKM